MIKHLTSMALLTAGATVALADAGELTRLLPADTDLVVLVSDVPRLKEASAESPLARAWADPEIQAWLAPLRERFNWEKFNEEARAETGVSPDEAMSWIDGAVVLAVRDLTQATATEGGAVPFIFAAQFGGNLEKATQFLEDMAGRRVDERQYRQEVETYGGVEVHALYPPEQDEDEAEAGEEGEEPAGAESDDRDDQPVVWAAHDGVLFLSAVKQEVLAMLDARQDGGAEAPLAGSARLERLQQIGGDSDVIVSLRIPKLVAAMEASLAAKAEAGGGNPMIPPARSIIEGLGLDAWEDFWFAWRIEGDESIGHYGLAYRRPAGLLSLLQHERAGFPRPEWIPADWKNVAVHRFELNQLLPRLQQIVTTISPPLGGMMQGMLAQMPQKTGVDLQRDLLGRFGDELVVVQRFEAVKPGDDAMAAMNQVPQMFVFSVNDGPGLEQALNTLIKSGGPAAEQMLKSRDYLGRRITSIQSPTPPGAPHAAPSFHYAISDRYFFLTMHAASPVEEALQALARGEGGFWDRDDVQAALEWVPADATGFQVQDLPSMLAVAVPAIEAALNASLETRVQQARQEAEEAGEDPDAAEAAVRGEARFTDPAHTPSPETFARYFGQNWSYFGHDGTSLRAVVRTLAPAP